MATGDQPDVAARLLAVLPPWFPSGAAPVLGALLQGPAWVLSQAYALIQYARAQTRLATASGDWIDLIAYDWLGRAVLRSGLSDDAFRARIRQNILQPAGTRPAIVAQLTALTGRAPGMADPWRPGDIGAYGCGTLGYGTSGMWGSLHMPAQTFVFAYRPDDGAHPAGTDAAILGSIAGCLPAGSQAWVQINS